MKITIEHEGVRCEVEDREVVTIYETIDLVKQAILGVGFQFPGELEIVEEEEMRPDDR